MTKRDILEQAIAIQETMRGTIPDDAINATIVTLRKQIANLDQTHPLEQHKQVTVLIAAFSGCSPTSVRKNTEDVDKVMRICLAIITPPICRHDGIIEKINSNEVMVIFGLLHSHDNNTENGIRAALEMQQAIDELNESSAEKRGFQLQMQIGINTGSVIVRYLGSLEGRDFMVVGETVDVAHRLVKSAPIGGVLISHDTYRHLQGDFDVLEQGQLHFKGVLKPLRTYLVQKVKPRAFYKLTRGVAGIETSMVGRNPELLMLQNIFRDATEEAEVHVVTIVGDAGVGKSRLLYEFEKWIELLPDDIWYFEGRATPENESMPYGLVRQIFTHRFDILESDSAEDVRRKFCAGMAPVLDPDQAALVGQMLGFNFSTNKVVQDQLGSESFGKLARDHLAKYIRVIASKPTVILLEDLHWADDSSLDLLDHLVAAIADTRLLVVCLSRPPLFERRPGWGEGQDFHTHILLKPLSRRASQTLVEEILQKADNLPAELCDLIVQRAEGNPFYVEELIKMLIEDKVIVPGKSEMDHWQIQLKRLTEIRVPPTLTGILQARLDSLPQREKTILQRASVVGRQFWDSAVNALTMDETQCMGKNELTSLLDSIREHELIFRRERSTFAETEEYIFKHALLRDVTYKTLPLKQRRMYHGQVAAWLETAASERLEEYLGLIAGHYELAGEKVAAVNYLQRAGDRARLAYAHQEAVVYYQRALTLLKEQGDHGHSARTLMKLGLVYHTAFDYQRSRQAYDEGFALLQKVEDVQPSSPLPAAPHAFRMARANPTTLDPTMADDSFSGGVINQLFSGLVEGRLALETMPDIAHSWKLSSDGRRYVFHLRDDVRWSDGMMLTAADFEYAWKRVLDPTNRSPNASLLYDIKGAKAFHEGGTLEWDSVGVWASDDLTLVVELEEPTGYFLSLLAHYATFPVPRHVVETHGETWTEISKIVTNGAFKLETWMRNKAMTLTRNPEYHRPFNGNLQRVEIAFDVEWSVQMEMYESGELDFLSFGGTPLDRDRARRRHPGEYFSAPMIGATYAGFDVSRPPFGDPRVRRAFALATNKVNLADVVLRGYEFPAMGGFVPPGMPGHSAGIGLPYDPEQARGLLAEAGYPGGIGFPVVDALTWQGIKSRAEFLQEQWRENLGVEIAWKVLDFQSFLETVDDVPVHIIQSVWMADYPDPDSVLRACPVQRRARWQNDVYGRLVEEARRTLDQRSRMELYAQADRILVQDEAVVIPLTYMWSHLLVKPWVRTLPKSAINEWLWKDFIIEPH